MRVERVEPQELLSFARKFLGVPYKMGAKAKLYAKPQGGFCYQVWLVGGPTCLVSKVARIDCSGLVYLVYRAKGIDLPHGSYFQVKSRYTMECSIKEALATPGALLFVYDKKKGRVCHVGISNGEGGACEANGYYRKVVERTAKPGYWTIARQVEGVHYGKRRKVA